MKQALTTISLLLILITLNSSCNENTEQSQNDLISSNKEITQQETEISNNLSSKKNSVLFKDTLKIGNYLLIVTQTDSSVKTVDYPPSLFKTYPEDKLLNTSIAVTRDSNSLSFYLRSGATFRLNDVPYTEDESNYLESVSYHYANNMNNYWLIDALCYEYNYTVFVNQDNGDTINSIAPGVVSPANDLLLCSNVDLETQFTWNGIELFKLNEEGHSKLGFLEIPHWGLTNLVWVSENKLNAVKVDMTENYNYELHNVTITLIKK